MIKHHCPWMRWVVMLLFVGMHAVWAQAEERSDERSDEAAAQVWEVEADRAELNLEEGVQQLYGNIHIHNVELSMRAQRARLVMSQDRIRRIELEGAPVQIELRRHEPQTQLNARRAEFDVGSGFMELQGAVELRHGSQSMNTQKLRYDTQSGKIVASGSQQGTTPERVRFRIGLE